MQRPNLDEKLYEKSLIIPSRRAEKPWRIGGYAPFKNDINLFLAGSSRRNCNVVESFSFQVPPGVSRCSFDLWLYDSVIIAILHMSTRELTRTNLV